MSSRTVPWDGSISHLSLQQRPDGSAAQGSRTIDTDEDSDRFCAYRNYRYGQSPARARAVLVQMSQAQAAGGFPGSWLFDLEPLGISRPGAQDADGRNSSGAGSLGNGGPDVASRAERSLPRFSFSRPGRQWSPTPLSPRSRLTHTQRTAAVQPWGSRQGNHAASTAHAHPTGNPAPEDDNLRRGR